MTACLPVAPTSLRGWKTWSTNRSRSAALKPRVGYAAAVVRGSAHLPQARAFVAGLLRGAGRADLTANGFLPAGGG